MRRDHRSCATYLIETGPETHIPPTLDLVSSAGNILLQWTGGDYWNDTPPDQLRYQHRLDEGDWSRAQRHHAFTFTSLDEGPHRIEVRAIDRDGNADPTPALHAFVVEGPWWKNPYVAGSGLVMLGLIALQTGRVVRRDRRVREANRELTIEAALERVRAHALGMQVSEELTDVADIFKTELDGLGLPRSAPFFIFPHEETETYDVLGQGHGCSIPGPDGALLRGLQERRRFRAGDRRLEGGPAGRFQGIQRGRGAACDGLVE